LFPLVDDGGSYPDLLVGRLGSSPLFSDGDSEGGPEVEDSDDAPSKEENAGGRERLLRGRGGGHFGRRVGREKRWKEGWQVELETWTVTVDALSESLKPSNLLNWNL
jgi:hypothetical protein